MKRSKIVTRAELRALKKAMSEQRRIIDVLSQRLQVVVSSLNCVDVMLRKHEGDAAPKGDRLIVLSAKSAKQIESLVDDLSGYRSEAGSPYDADELLAINELQDAAMGVGQK